MCGSSVLVCTVWTDLCNQDVGLVKMQLAEKMNDVWQLRVGVHRVFYFWHGDAQRYVMLNGFRKQTRRTPPAELQRAEALRVEHLATGGGK